MERELCEASYFYLLHLNCKIIFSLILPWNKCLSQFCKVRGMQMEFIITTKFSQGGSVGRTKKTD